MGRFDSVDVPVEEYSNLICNLHVLKEHELFICGREGTIINRNGVNVGTLNTDSMLRSC